MSSTYKRALLDPIWLSAMRDEFDALQQNKTWTLVPKPSGVNVVFGKCGFHHKFHDGGTLSRYKACWVCRGFSQQQGIDYEEIFSPVVKSSTIRLFLVLLFLLHGLFTNSMLNMLFFMVILLKWSIVNIPMVLRTPQLLIMFVFFINPFMVNKPLVLGSNVLRLLLRLLVFFPPKQTLLFLSSILLIILPIFYSMLMT
jgi:hypothetical protein